MCVHYFPVYPRYAQYFASKTSESIELCTDNLKVALKLISINRRSVRKINIKASDDLSQPLWECRLLPFLLDQLDELPETDLSSWELWLVLQATTFSASLEHVSVLRMESSDLSWQQSSGFQKTSHCPNKTGKKWVHMELQPIWQNDTHQCIGSQFLLHILYAQTFAGSKVKNSCLCSNNSLYPSGKALHLVLGFLLIAFSHRGIGVTSN